MSIAARRSGTLNPTWWSGRTRKDAAIARLSELMPGFAERVALRVGEHLDRRYTEHDRLSIGTGVSESSVAGGPFPPPVPFRGERLGDSSEYEIVRHLGCVSFRSEERRVGKECRSRWSTD